MKNKIIFTIVSILFCQAVAWGQLNLKRDDFVGSQRRAWWQWRDDGPNTPPPSVMNGYVLFSLVDPTEDYRPFYDSALWDGFPGIGGPWYNCTMTVRAKALNPHKSGSRGWGLWYTEPFPYVQQQIWFMESKDETGITQENWWRAETAFGINEATHHYVDLDLLADPIDIELWHTYKIVRESGFIQFLVDNQQVHYVTDDLPNQGLAVHIWVDNLVYEFVPSNPDPFIRIHHREWTGKNEFILDYIQVLPGGTDLETIESPAGIKKLRNVVNAIYDGSPKSIWKDGIDYTFDSPSPSGGFFVFLLTGRVEQYLDGIGTPLGDDDDIKVEIDGQDYGWETSTSFNGDAQGTISKTLVLTKNIPAGDNKQIKIYGDISPLLYDVTAVGSENGGIIFDQEYNETKSASSDSLWKEIDIPTWGGEVAIYVSASADEDPSPSRYGYEYLDFNDDEDDDLRIELVGVQDYGYKNENAFYGNRQFGEPKSVMVVNNLSTGWYTLRLYGQGTPTLHRVLVYGEFDDQPLPVTLSVFDVHTAAQGNIISWKTESEIDNLGFNIYKAASPQEKSEGELNFFKLNPTLILGAGNTTQTWYYSFEDKMVQDGWYYWYYLEDVDFNGQTERHPIKMVFREPQVSNKFELLQNYPNPFNQSTWIPYELKTEEKVHLMIYSVSGELVFSKSLGRQPAGKHAWRWNGKNKKGIDLSSGIYYYQMVSGQRSRVKSLVLIR